VSAPRLPSDLRERVLAAVSREPVRSRAAGNRRRAVVLVLGFCVGIACSVPFGPPDIGPRPIGYFALVVGVWVLVAALASWGAVGRGRSMLGRPTAHKLAIALVAPAVLLAAALLGNVLWPETIDASSSVQAHAFCAALAMLFAVGPLAGFAMVARGSDPIAPTVTGAALGAAAGTWGALGIELFCSQATPAHVLLGHVLPVLLLALTGALLGARVLRVVAVPAKNE